MAIGVQVACNPQPTAQANVACTEANRTAAAEPLADRAEAGLGRDRLIIRIDQERALTGSTSAAGHRGAFTARGRGDAQPLLRNAGGHARPGNPRSRRRELIINILENYY